MIFKIYQKFKFITGKIFTLIKIIKSNKKDDTSLKFKFDDSDESFIQKETIFKNELCKTIFEL